LSWRGAYNASTMTTEATPIALYKRIKPEEAGSVSSGLIQVAPEIVESALDRIAASDDASFPLGGPLDQAVERSNGSGPSASADRGS
jgi:hypothetical protein